MNIYFSDTFFYTSAEYRRTMAVLKGEFKKYPWFNLYDHLMPCTPSIASDDGWHRPQSSEFLERADVLIVETTHTTFDIGRLVSQLFLHNIFLIVCTKRSAPRSSLVLNKRTSALQKIVWLEYKDISDIKSHILTYITFHHVRLQLLAKK